MRAIRTGRGNSGPGSPRSNGARNDANTSAGNRSSEKDHLDHRPDQRRSPGNGIEVPGRQLGRGKGIEPVGEPAGDHPAVEGGVQFGPPRPMARCVQRHHAAGQVGRELAQATTTAEAVHVAQHHPVPVGPVADHGLAPQLQGEHRRQLGALGQQAKGIAAPARDVTQHAAVARRRPDAGVGRHPIGPDDGVGAAPPHLPRAQRLGDDGDRGQWRQGDQHRGRPIPAPGLRLDQDPFGHSQHGRQPATSDCRRPRLSASGAA